MVVDLLRRLFKGKPSHARPAQEALIDVTGGSLKRVYWLTEDLRKDPGRVKSARALTRNANAPLLGLKGKYGLFASAEWWSNINNRVMPLEFVSGTIVRVYEPGWDQEATPNKVQLRVVSGRLVDVGIHLNDLSDIALFEPGAQVELVYALDEFKKQPAEDGGVACLRVALEIAVSVRAERFELRSPATMGRK